MGIYFSFAHSVTEKQAYVFQACDKKEAKTVGTILPMVCKNLLPLVLNCTCKNVLAYNLCTMKKKVL